MLSASPGEVRLALLADSEIRELLIERGEPARGDILCGRVIALERAAGIGFVEIGAARAGFLRRIGKLSEGQAVTVRVTGPARGGKGAELVLESSSAPTVADASMIHRALSRALAENPGIEAVEIGEAAALGDARSLFPAATLKRDAWAQSGADEALAEALAPTIPLARGGAIRFSETPGGTVIDIDGGGETPQAANFAALPLIARHIRLRGLAGHILVDAIPMRGRSPLRQFVEKMRAALAGDPVPTQIAGATPLGMVEITRERRRPTLAEALLEAAPSGFSPVTMALSGLRALLREAEARPAARPALLLIPEAARALARLPEAQAEAEARLGRKIIVIETPGLDNFALTEESR